jgi:hypothetical protein
MGRNQPELANPTIKLFIGTVEVVVPYRKGRRAMPQRKPSQTMGNRMIVEC